MINLPCANRSETEKMMQIENLEGHWVKLQGKTT